MAPGKTSFSFTMDSQKKSKYKYLKEAKKKSLQDMIL